MKELLPWIVGVVFGAGSIYASFRVLKKFVDGLGGKMRRMIAEQIIDHSALVTLNESDRRRFAEFVRRLLG